MRLPNNPKWAALADGVYRNRRYIRQQGIDTMATCPMCYEFRRAHRIGVRVVLHKGRFTRWLSAVWSPVKQRELVTNGVWQQKAVPYRTIRGVEHSGHGPYH